MADDRAVGNRGFLADVFIYSNRIYFSEKEISEFKPAVLRLKAKDFVSHPTHVRGAGKYKHCTNNGVWKSYDFIFVTMVSI